MSTPETDALSDDDREHLTAVVKSWLPLSYGGLIPRLELWLTERDQRLVAEAIEALAAEAEAFPDDEHDSGGQLADWLRRRMPNLVCRPGQPAD